MKDREIFYRFCVKAFDAGIVEAEVGAIVYFQLSHDYTEQEKRLINYYQNLKIIDYGSIGNILNPLNALLKNVKCRSDKLITMVDKLKKIELNCPHKVKCKLIENDNGLLEFKEI